MRIVRVLYSTVRILRVYSYEYTVAITCAGSAILHKEIQTSRHYLDSQFPMYLCTEASLQ